MKTLLQLRTSIYSEQGESSRLANHFAERWRAANPGGRVIVRDFAREPVPHLDAASFGAFAAKPGERNWQEAQAARHSDALIEELKLADIVVIGLPMYNFGLPSVLKAYFDHIARVGITFRYTDKGPVGLLTGKKVYVFAARGGIYNGMPRDTQTPYMRDFLGFLGMTDVEFVYAEGLAMGPEVKKQSLAKALAQVDRLVPVLATQ